MIREFLAVLFCFSVLGAQNSRLQKGFWLESTRKRLVGIQWKVCIGYASQQGASCRWCWIWGFVMQQWAIQLLSVVIWPIISHPPAEMWPPFPSALLHLIWVRFPLQLPLLEGTNPKEFMSALNCFLLRIVMTPTGKRIGQGELLNGSLSETVITEVVLNGAVSVHQPQHKTLLKFSSLSSS